MEPILGNQFRTLILYSIICVLLIGELKALIERDFGSVKTMQEQLSAASVTVQGSGWGWLVRNNAYMHTFQHCKIFFVMSPVFILSIKTRLACTNINFEKKEIFKT